MQWRLQLQQLQLLIVLEEAGAPAAAPAAIRDCSQGGFYSEGACNFSTARSPCEDQSKGGCSLTALMVSSTLRLAADAGNLCTALILTELSEVWYISRNHWIRCKFRNATLGTF